MLLTPDQPLTIFSGVIYECLMELFDGILETQKIDFWVEFHISLDVTIFRHFFWVMFLEILRNLIIAILESLAVCNMP